MTQFDRRTLLRRAGMLATAAIGVQLGAAACGEGPSRRRPKLSGYPFRLGVASGDPVSDGFVIWTRLAPDPFDPEALKDDTIDVQWEVASDAQFTAIVQKGYTQARAGLGHSARVELRGLQPNRPYWYRFGLRGGDTSPVGRARTAPTVGSPLSAMKIAHCSCQHYEQGYFNAYDLMLTDQPDLIVHLGDYIYESSWGKQARRHEGPEPLSLADYRARHALYKLDESLAAAHAACPWLLTWDDHEVDNDYASLESEDYQKPEAFVARRAAAYQAYFENMPVRGVAYPRSAETRLYQRSQFGDLVEIAMMDTRQYRSGQACRTPERGGAQVVPHETCSELFDPTRTILGRDQERWLTRGFGRSTAKWNVLGSAQMISRLKQKTADGKDGSWTDDWNGYPESRKTLSEAIVKSKLSNPMILVGDFHSFWVNDFKADFNVGDSATIATEIVGSSISSAGPDFDTFTKMLPDNPHVKLFESRKRGYALNTITPKSWRIDLRTVADVTTRSSKGETFASFVVEDGKPGAVKA
ncbi:MAG TPA: alkaline phosphatase [Alphaproteobacteria bacterium]|nr:alkaline phosphatase [Alphaproteobacteria bacterium]